MTRLNIRDEYFNWMFEMVCSDHFSASMTYSKLMSYLHDVEFVYLMSGDADRAADGKSLRRRFALTLDSYNYDYIMDCLDRPCSVLEMMIALAIRCEESIMDDPNYGNRTSQWFWKMISSLGLSGMVNSRFDMDEVEDIVTTFLNREYKYDGHGGLFIVNNSIRDFRKVEIWRQMCYYLDTNMINI